MVEISSMESGPWFLRRDGTTLPCTFSTMSAIVLAFDDHHERDATFDLSDVGFVDEVGEYRANVSARS